MCQKGFGLRMVQSMQLQVPRKPIQQRQGMCRAKALPSSQQQVTLASEHFGTQSRLEEVDVLWNRWGQVELRLDLITCLRCCQTFGSPCYHACSSFSS